MKAYLLTSGGRKAHRNESQKGEEKYEGMIYKVEISWPSPSSSHISFALKKYLEKEQ